MTALIVIGTIILLLLIPLLSPAGLDVAYQGGNFKARAHYLFFTFDLLPGEQAEKATRKPKTKKEKKKKDEEEKPKSAKDTANTIWSLVKSAPKGLNILRRHLIFSRVKLYICVGGPDAHQIAVNQSKLRLAVLTALDIVGLLFVLKEPEAGILPDFTAQSNTYDLSLRVSIRPLFVLAAACSILIHFLRLQRGSRRKETQNIKGGNIA